MKTAENSLTIWATTQFAIEKGVTQLSQLNSDIDALGRNLLWRTYECFRKI
jgi:hypothetical protein